MLLSFFRPAPVANNDIRSALLEHANSLKTYCARLSTAGQQAEELGDQELASYFRTAAQQVMKTDFSLKRRSEDLEQRYHQEVIKVDISMKHCSEECPEQNCALAGEYEELLKEVEAAERIDLSTKMVLSTLAWLFVNPTPPQAVDELEEKRWTFLTNHAYLQVCWDDLAEALQYAKDCEEVTSAKRFECVQAEVKAIQAWLKNRDSGIMELLDAEPSMRPQFVSEYQKMLTCVEYAEELCRRTLQEEGAEDLKFLCSKHNFFTSAMTGYSWMLSDAYDFVVSGFGYNTPPVLINPYAEEALSDAIPVGAAAAAA